MKQSLRKQRLVADINITPFTDVILVLLVIFMITTPLISQSNIKVNLPEARSGLPAGKNRQQEAEVTITREGVVYLDGKLVTRKELKDQVKKMYVNDPELSVTVRSDKFVRFQEIVNVLDPLTELGVTKLNIAATTENE
ncbi:MAG: biopolymer transporter ExbD [Candidatus Omnitrophica bacterium]|nr:biopolymer transporter ExbD [Candidatus Omnitrophota bacterium]